MKTEQDIHEYHSCQNVDEKTYVDDENSNTCLKYSRTEDHNDLDLSKQEQKRKSNQK